MEYAEIRLIKQSEKSTVHLVKPRGDEQVFVRKILKGKRPIYSTLQNCRHPYLPRVEEVIISDDVTTIIEEYVEGETLGSAELSEKQIVCAAKELCDVLEFLHEKEIIHRDIKPSNLILAKDAHIRLIDFDAARMPKDDLEQDTRLLGTRGYAPPEQYGFSQTDARADIYAFGVTLRQLLGERAVKPHFKRIIQKCTNLNPDKRYQTAKQVKRALSYRKRCAVYSGAAVILTAILLWTVLTEYLVKPEMAEDLEQKDTGAEPVELTVLDAPVNPHWNGETGIGVWGNVPEDLQWKMYEGETERVFYAIWSNLDDYADTDSFNVTVYDGMEERERINSMPIKGSVLKKLETNKKQVHQSGLSTNKIRDEIDK